MEQIMEKFEDGDVSIQSGILDRYGWESSPNPLSSKLWKNFEASESRFVNGVEIFTHALYENVGESNVDAAQLYLKALLKYHRDLIK